MFVVGVDEVEGRRPVLFAQRSEHVYESLVFFLEKQEDGGDSIEEKVVLSVLVEEICALRGISLIKVIEFLLVEIALHLQHLHLFASEPEESNQFSEFETLHGVDEFREQIVFLHGMEFPFAVQKSEGEEVGVFANRFVNELGLLLVERFLAQNQQLFLLD